MVGLVCRDRTADETGIFYMYHGSPFKMVFGNNTGFGIEQCLPYKSTVLYNIKLYFKDDFFFFLVP